MEHLWKTLQDIWQSERKEHRTLLLAVDRDGTLVPIEANPERAIMLPQVREDLRRLAVKPHIKVATISARPVHSLVEDFGENALIIAGNYGLEINYPDGTWDIQATALQARPQLVEARDALAAGLKPEWNVILEDHRFSLCAHWHLTPSHLLPHVHALIAEVFASSPNLKLVPRPTSYEFFPKMEWSKADALDRIAQELNGTFMPIYFGDSEADECAFVWANSHGGISVKIGEDGCETVARYQLGSPEKLHLLLSRFVTLVQSCESAKAPSKR